MGEEKLPPKILNWKKEKRETKNKMEIRHT
jgi:hypothetical protein